MAVSVGSVSIDVVPSAANFARDLRKKLLPQAAVVGKEMGKAIAEEVGKALGDAPSKSPTEQYRKEGAKAGGAYGSALKQSIEAAIRSLPDIEIDADSSEAQREIAEVRKELTSLGDKKIGIDLSADEANAKLDEFRAKLARLANDKDITLDVKANTAAAVAEIDKFKAEAARVRDIKVNVDADTSGALAKITSFTSYAESIAKDIHVNVDVDTGAAVAKVALLTGALLAIPAAAGGATYAIGSLGAALAPAIGILGALPAAIGAAAAAFGALKIGFSGFGSAISEAVKGQDALGASAGAAAKKAASSADQIASAQRSVQNAYQTLDNTRANVDAAAEKSARQVASARANLASATQEAAAKETQARQEAAAAVRKAEDSATKSIQAALQRQASAQKTLSRATADLRREQATLNDAWREGREALEDLQDQVDDNALDQRQAAFDLADAKKALDEARAGGNADEIARAQLAYDRQVESIDQLNKKTARLTSENRQAQAAGVAGSEAVTSANERIASAVEKVQDAQQAAGEADRAVNQARIEGAASVAEAQRQGQQKIAEAQASGAKQVASAQQALTNAILSQQEQQRTGQQQIANAQRAVADAQAALSKAYQKTGDDANTAMDKAKAAMDKLSPAAQAAARAILALKPAWDALRLDVQERLFDGLAAKITNLGNLYIPVLRAGLGGLAAEFNVTFKTIADVLARPANVSGISTALDNIRLGFRGILSSSGAVTQAFVDMTIAGSTLFPQLGQQIGNAVTRFAEFLSAASRSGQLVQWINAAIGVFKALWQIVASVGSILASVFRAADAAGANFLGTLGALTGKIAEFMRSAEGQNALVTLFTNIRAAVDAAMPGFQTILGAIGYLITSLAPVLPQLGAAFSAVVGALRPLFDLLVGLASVVLPPLLWLITNFPAVFIGLAIAIFAAVQAFTALKAIVEIAAVVQKAMAIPAIASMVASTWAWVTALWAQAAAMVAAYWPILLIIAVIGLLVAAVIYAWNNFDWFRNAVMAVWNGIATAASWVWTTILQPIFSAIWAVIQWVGGAFVWLWQSVFVPAWNGIATAATWTWTNILEPVFSALLTIMKYIGVVIFVVLVTPFVIAWNLISAAVQWAWEAVILPIWNALVSFAQNVIAPAMVWLYQNIILPIWNAIGAAISWVWNSIILPVYNALVYFQNNIMAPALQWLYNYVILPIWNAIGAAISFVWNSIILPIWNALVFFIQQIMAPAINWLYYNIVKPVWDAIGAAISFVWTNVISPAFNAIWGGLQWLGDRFVDATNRIRDIWNMIKGFLAKPINFLIDTVWNHGIVPVWNAVAGLVGIGPIQPYPLIPEFATGGQINGPGTGTSDSILARVSNGEFVVREKVAQKATPFLNALNAGDGEALQAAGATRAGKSRKFSGDSGLGMNPMDVVPKFATGGLIDQRIAAAKQWLSGPARGIPYVWGGGSQSGMDCSGMQAAVTHILSGRSPMSGRIGTTASMPWGGFVPGLNGQYAVGNKPSDHMAGTLAGQNVEQHGPSGTPFQFPSRWGADNGYFPQKFHLAEVGGQFVSGGNGGGGGFNPIRWAIEKAFGAIRDPLVNGIRAFTGPPPPAWRDVPPNLAGKSIDTLRDFLLSKADALFGGGGVMGATSDEAPQIVRIISDVAKGRFGGLAKQAATIGVATGLVESNLRNLAGGDRDSVGVFQQRPSQGWGTIEQCRNVSYAAGSFFSRFPGGWAGMDPGAVAQSVQRSAFPGRYSQRMGQAAGLVNQFGGFDQGGIGPGKGFMPKNVIQPERVLSPRQTRSFDTLVRNLDSGRTSSTNPGGGSFTGNLYLDSGEFMGKVHGAINSADDNAARQLVYGRS